MSGLNHSTPNTNGQADHGDGELPTDQRTGVSSVLTSYILPEMTANDRQEMGIDSPSTGNDLNQTSVSMPTAVMSEFLTSSDDVQSIYVTDIRPGTPTAEPRVVYNIIHSEDEENGDAVPRSQADTASSAVNGRDPNRRRRANNGEHPTPLSSHLPQDDSATREQWESAWNVQRGRSGEHGRTSLSEDSTQTVHPHTPSNSPASLDNQSVDSLTSPGRNRRAPGPAPSLTHMSSSDSKAFFNQFRDEERDGGSA